MRCKSKLKCCPHLEPECVRFCVLPPLLTLRVKSRVTEENLLNVKKRSFKDINFSLLERRRYGGKCCRKLHVFKTDEKNRNWLYALLKMSAKTKAIFFVNDKGVAIFSLISMIVLIRGAKKWDRVFHRATNSVSKTQVNSPTVASFPRRRGHNYIFHLSREMIFFSK